MPLAAFLFGIIFGSFLNALLFRYNTGRSVMRGRSRCMSCNSTLTAADLVPLLSYAYLGGRCRYCGSRVSWQYPLVEAFAGGISLLAYLSHPDPVSYSLWLLVGLTTLFLAVYDLRHMILPPQALALLGVLALLAVLLPCASGACTVLIPLAAGPILAAPLFLLSLVSMGRWMGWADSALELSLGWLLGLTAGLTALMLAFWIGAAVGLLRMAFNRGVTMNSEVPFAPFLIVGAFVALAFHVDFFANITLL